MDWRRGAIAVALLTSPPPALAQTPSGTSGIEQLLQQRQRQLQEHQVTSPNVKLKSPAPIAQGLLRHGETPCFPIDHIELSGQLSGQFQWIISAAGVADDGRSDPWVGRCLGTQGINMLIGRMQNALVARGFITTRVVAGMQNLKSRNLRIVLVPGSVKAILFKGTPSRLNNAMTALPIRPGYVLNLRDVEQGLENFRRLPTVSTEIQIAPAKGPDAKAGQSDLVIDRHQRFPLRLDMSADNSGTKETGLYNGSLTLSEDGLLGLNDNIYINVTHDLGGGVAIPKGTRSQTLHAEVPYGYWMFGATASDSTYHQTVVGSAQNYIYSGDVGSVQFRLSRLIWRNARAKTTLWGELWGKHSHNFVDGTEIPVQKLRMAGWQLGVSEHANLASATLDADLSWKRGTGADGALAAPGQAAGTGTSRMRITTANATLGVPWQWTGRALHYNLSANMQWNGTPLVPLDRFSIGSRYTVRGFDGEELLSGERGWFVRNDLAMELPSINTQVYAGLDHGKVGGPSAQYLVGTRLTGAAIGIKGRWPHDVSYDLYFGMPVSRPTGFITRRQVFAFTISMRV